MALVIAGVVVSTRAVPPPGTSHRQLLGGIGWGAAAMATLALGIVIAKPVLEEVPVLWAVTVRQVASFAVMAPAAALMTSRRQVWNVFRPDPSWRFTLPATILGSYLALMCWIGGMKLTDAGTASILNQTSTIFILVLASVILHEPFTWRRGLSAVLGVIGILCVTLG
jgi:drug/metabolite transporter (DMT)-like permease